MTPGSIPANNSVSCAFRFESSAPGVPAAELSGLPAGRPAISPVRTTRSGDTTPRSAASNRHGNPAEALRSGVRQAQGEAELLGQVQEDVEELRLELHGVEVGVEMAHVETPVDGPFELSPALAADLVEVGVVPEVGWRPREPAVTVEQGRGLGDRSPAVQVVLGVERESDADVLTPVLRRGLTRPRSGDQQRRGGGGPSRSAS